jgi:hypothetical protein
MTDEQRAEIERLSKDAFQKRERFEALGIAATSDDYETRMKQAIEYAVAEAEAIEAQGKLAAAMLKLERAPDTALR